MKGNLEDFFLPLSLSGRQMSQGCQSSKSCNGQKVNYRKPKCPQERLYHEDQPKSLHGYTKIWRTTSGFNKDQLATLQCRTVNLLHDLKSWPKKIFQRN